MEIDQKIEASKKYFDREKKNVSNQDVSPSHQLVFERVVALIPAGQKNQRAVDLGCHWGRYCRVMAGSYGLVVGLDFAEKAISSAFQAPNIRYQVCDLEKNPGIIAQWAPIDFYLAVGLFEMLKTPELLCRHLHQNTAKRGRVLVVIPNRKSINYRLFKLKYALAGFLTRSKRFFVYNNGIELPGLIGHFQDAGFHIVSTGKIVGIPIYLTEHLPPALQKILLKLDSMFLKLFGGAYFWVLAEKRG